MRISAAIARNLLTPFVCAIVLALSATTAAAAIEQTASFPGDRLSVRNLIGEVRVEAGGGAGFEVVVRVDGRDAREGLIEIVTSEDRLDIRLPQGESEFVYPRLEAHEKVELSIDKGDWLSDLVGEVLGTSRVRVRGAGKGTQLWADVLVRVPPGSSVAVQHGVGKVIAKGVEADLELATNHGVVMLDGSRGRIEVATGSGDVELAGVSGPNLEVATGSGDVLARDCDSERLEIASGSGDITLAGIRGAGLEVATGSGDVEAERLEADGVEIATGSGDVELELGRLGSEGCSVGTGSGDITLSLPSDSAADLHAETSGGRIVVDLAGDLDYRTQQSDEVRLSVGGGGADIELGSGNGDIRIRN